MKLTTSGQLKVPLKSVGLFVALCVVASLALLPLFKEHLTSLSHKIFWPEKQAELPHGSLQPLLFNQRLSHRAAHTSELWLYFLSLLEPRTVAIAGVEWGGDAVNFAKAGFRVHAIEPGERYVRRLRRRLEKNPTWDIVIHPYAATNESNATMEIMYHGQVVASRIQTRRLDDLVHERVALLSADVQGGELSILRGASGLLPHMVDSILVELGKCRQATVDILRMLDADYALFDFVPWGHHRETTNETLVDLRNYGVDDERPGEFERYNEWFCEKRRDFHWMQTDVLAVRRDLVPQLWTNLERIAETQCGQTEDMCLLRRLTAMGRPKSEPEAKDEH